VGNIGATKTGEAIRFTRRDEFISIVVTTTNFSPMGFAKAHAATLEAGSPGYKGQPMQAYKVANANGAMVAYTKSA